MGKTYQVSLEISGSTAMWTRPDVGDTPVSYPAPTYSAVKGIFESICWLKSAIVKPTRVEIMSPLVFHTYSTNYGGPLRKSKAMKGGNSYQLLATVLINVRYRLFATVEPMELETNRHSEASRRYQQANINGPHAYFDMFQRRLERGQWYCMPCLGWKEFVPDYVGAIREPDLEPANINTVMPSMLNQVFSRPTFGNIAPSFRQNVNIDKGVLTYAE